MNVGIEAVFSVSDHLYPRRDLPYVLTQCSLQVVSIKMLFHSKTLNLLAQVLDRILQHFLVSSIIYSDVSRVLLRVILQTVAY